MTETKRMAEEAKRMGQEYQEHARNMGQEFQRAAESGFEAANRSFSEVNRGLQAFAAEMTDYSKRSLEDVFRAWEQLLGARSFGEVVDIQARYAQKAYDTYMSQMSKFGELSLNLTRDAAKQGEQAVRRSA
jgi:hypothetical protein